MHRELSVLTPRAEPLTLDALVEALKRRGFSPRIEVGHDGDPLLKDRRDPRPDTGGVWLSWARPAHKDRLPPQVERAVLSYDLAVGAALTGWDHYLMLNATLCVAELARGFVVLGEEAEDAEAYALRLECEGAHPFAVEAVAVWEAAHGMAPAAPADEPEPPPEEPRGLSEVALELNLPIEQAMRRAAEALAAQGVESVPWNTESGMDAGPFGLLALTGDASDLLVVATKPWTEPRQARALKRLGDLRLKRSARVRFASSEPLPARLAYAFGMDGRGDLELELLTHAREMPKLSAQNAPAVASLGRDALKRRLGQGLPTLPEAALRTIDRMVLDTLRPTRERTAAVAEDDYVPECTLVVLGCVAGEALLAHPALAGRWIDGQGALPLIEARKKGAEAAEPARTSPIARAFDLYTKGVAWRFEALLPRPAAPRVPAPIYAPPARPLPKAPLRMAGMQSSWLDRLLGRR